jgi:hypothetical protein
MGQTAAKAINVVTRAEDLLSFSLWEKVARKRRMRADRPTISSFAKIVGRIPLTRRYRATLSQREREKGS